MNDIIKDKNKKETKVIKIWNKTKGKCWYCGINLNIKFNNNLRKNNFIIEHQNDRSNKIENLFPSCQSCNNKKKSKNLEEFRKYYFKDHTFNERHKEILKLNNIDFNKLFIPKNYFYGEKI